MATRIGDQTDYPELAQAIWDIIVECAEEFCNPKVINEIKRDIAEAIENYCEGN